jgi:hypothetical protein
MTDGDVGVQVREAPVGPGFCNACRAAVERLDRAAPRAVVFCERVLGRGSLADRQRPAFVSEHVRIGELHLPCQ